MQSKIEMLEFLDSLLTIHEWDQNELEIIAQIRSEVEQSKTNGHLKEILVEGIKAIPYIADWINEIGGI